ncbi:uncharacterized protein LOC114730541 [Neltuma alba]|uniref:uncharacterized protein LOC114730541 n=1 Tax=Neltuma alba TaxID=207710 RepID=UPI0010A56F04|nr:uncharacterized protein LOC114730541 [Prosopis alba]
MNVKDEILYYIAGKRGEEVIMATTQHFRKSGKRRGSPGKCSDLSLFQICGPNNGHDFWMKTPNANDIDWLVEGREWPPPHVLQGFYLQKISLLLYSSMSAAAKVELCDLSTLYFKETCRKRYSWSKLKTMATD